MTKNNKRINDRVTSINLISYVCTDNHAKIIENGMGKTLNVSESGILLETHNQIDSSLNLLLSIGLEEVLIDIKGKVVHSTQVDEGRYHTGIQFIDLDDNSRKKLAKFILEFKSSQKLI